MKHKLWAFLILGILILLVPVCGKLQYEDRWYDGTVINGIDCSGLTLEETIASMDGTGYTLTVAGRNDGEITITGEEIALETDAAEQLTAAFETQHDSFFLLKLLHPDTLTVTISVTCDEDALLSIFESSKLVTGSDDYPIIQPSSASVVWDGTMFSVKEHEEGNVLIVEDAMTYIKAAVISLRSQIDLSQLDVYKTIQVEYGVDELTAACIEANCYALHWISWEMADGTIESLTPDVLSEWVTVANTDVTFNEDALCEWIEDLCTVYKTIGTEREFTTHDGEVITVSGGDYGWRLNYSEMCEDALEVVCEADEAAVTAYMEEVTDETLAALTVTLEPVYRQTAYQLDGTTDWDTENYSEVDISEQMVYVYQNGVLAYSCKCVTGLPDGERDTTTGIWYIKDKKTEYTLTSTTYGYSTPTKYWVRITWTGIGYHYMARSDWSSWSSTLYLTAGSHGCINLQLADAAAIYSLVSLYDAVIIHD